MEEKDGSKKIFNCKSERKTRYDDVVSKYSEEENVNEKDKERKKDGKKERKA